MYISVIAMPPKLQEMSLSDNESSLLCPSAAFIGMGNEPLGASTLDEWEINSIIIITTVSGGRGSHN